MSPTLTTFLFEAANFLVLAVGLGWLFFNPVRQALADRRAKLEAETVRATEALAAAEKTQQQTDVTRANLQVELNELRARELEAAQRQAAQILADARAAAQREREMSHRQAARMSDTQRDALGDASAEAAAEMVRRLLDQIEGPDLHAALVESACRQLAALPPGAVAPVTVESAQPLSPAHHERVSTALGPAADTADFKTIEGLGDGVRISTGHGLIDASVGGLGRFARQALTTEVHRRASRQNPLRRTNDG